jgi:hypothetical protein
MVRERVRRSCNFRQGFSLIETSIDREEIFIGIYVMLCARPQQPQWCSSWVPSSSDVEEAKVSSSGELERTRGSDVRKGDSCAGREESIRSRGGRTVVGAWEESKGARLIQMLEALRRIIIARLTIWWLETR